MRSSGEKIMIFKLGKINDENKALDGVVTKNGPMSPKKRDWSIFCLEHSKRLRRQTDLLRASGEARV